MKTSPVIIEACVTSAESALIAQEGGAARIELCDNIVEGGTTPSAGMIELTRKHCDLKLHILIRPRGGDFCYSDIEFEVMKRDVALAKQMGADGVVFGILNPDGNIDFKRTKLLTDAARPLSVTFHRAFDMSKNPYRALEDLATIRVNRILTSGGSNTALEGLNAIAELVKQANERLSIMACGGINPDNCRTIVRQSGVKEIHVGGAILSPSPMYYRNEEMRIGKPFIPQEYVRFHADGEKLRALVRALS